MTSDSYLRLVKQTWKKSDMYILRLTRYSLGEINVFYMNTRPKIRDLY